jgi:peptidoglycan/xylan/chitin deacetylase (PgdA/CDA1 family)
MMRIVSLLFHDVFVREPLESGFSSASANRYKLALRSFDDQLAHLVRSIRDSPVMAADLANASHRAETRFVMTFDDGGVSYYTSVADRLEALGWRGHCFVTTDRIGSRGFLSARQIHELDVRGHAIGTHSASHPARFSACRRDEMSWEWTRSRSVLEDLLGHPVTIASLPGGYFSGEVARTAAEAGLRVLFTSTPTTRLRQIDGCTIVGRYALRSGCSPAFAAQLARVSPWARLSVWTSWNAKSLPKKALGSSYSRVADWIAARVEL